MMMKGDELEHEKMQSLSELMSSKPMKRVAKLLVSLSLFSVLFSYKLWCSNPILALPIQLLSHALDKNYIFLICNGILVLLAKTSGRIVRSSPASYDLSDDVVLTPHSKFPDSLLHKEAHLEETALPLLENAHFDDHDDQEAKEEEKNVIEEEKEDIVINMGDEQEAMEEDSRSYAMEGDDDEEVYVEDEKEVVEEREELNKLSTEELNKKFEEFIRKTKEDIRIEAQQQQHFVMVK